MFIPDPAATGTLIKNIADFFKLLRERVKNKDFFEIVSQLQCEQSKLEDRMREAEAEVTRLNDEITRLKQQHAGEIEKLMSRQADEITRTRKAQAENVARRSQAIRDANSNADLGEL